MDRLFSVLGKIFLVVLLLIIVLGAGYYIGTNKNNSQTTTETKITKATENTPTPSVFITPTAIPSPTKQENKKTIAGGLSSGTSFVTYTVDIPSTWSDKHEVTPNVIDKLTLTKDAYSLTIYQAAIGGGGCLYPGDADAMMAQKFTNFVDITSNGNAYRRSWNTSGQGTISYTICQKGNDNSYGAPTKFGAISATAPNPVDDTILKEIDTIIASIKKQ